MNVVILSGTMVRDPSVSSNGSVKVARFNIATRRSFKDKDGNYGADFPNCTAFGKTADFVESYFHKGSQIAVTGRINTGNYTNKDGQTIYTTDVAVEKVEFVGSKSDNSASTVDAVPVADKPVDKPKRSSKAAPAQPQADEFISIPDSIDDIPFVN